MLTEEIYMKMGIEDKQELLKADKTKSKEIT